MKAYTDMPFDFLGDKPGEEAPIREVLVYGWDENKYVTLSVMGLLAEVKAGYIYPKPARVGEVKAVDTKLYKYLSYEERETIWGGDASWT